MNKSELRQQAKLLEGGRLTQQSLSSFSYYQEAKVILAYVALPYECNIHAVLEQVLIDDKILYLPKVAPNMKLTYHKVTDLAKDLEVGSYGIQEPKSSLEPWSSTQLLRQQHLLLAPALATNKEGYRLGHGMGYYDRFLDSLSMQQREAVTTIAVVNDKMRNAYFMVEDHDIAFDYILSEVCLVRSQR